MEEILRSHFQKLNTLDIQSIVDYLNWYTKMTKRNLDFYINLYVRLTPLVDAGICHFGLTGPSAEAALNSKNLKDVYIIRPRAYTNSKDAGLGEAMLMFSFISDKPHHHFIKLSNCDTVAATTDKLRILLNTNRITILKLDLTTAEYPLEHIAELLCPEKTNMSLYDKPLNMSDGMYGSPD